MRTNCPNITVHQMGQRELIDKVSAFTSWANLGSHPASCKLCGPTRQSRAAANCVLDGPMRANCLNITGHEIGPCEGMRTSASRPPWANPSSSTRSVHSHSGPTSAAIPLAANYVGPRDSLVWQPIVCFMGQCELNAQILRCMKWAHAGACAGGLQASVGKPERIGNVRMVGQCELIAQILWCMKWAHVRACARGPPGLCGLTRAHRQGQCIHIVGQPRQPSR